MTLRQRHDGRPWLTYTLASVPGWTFAAIVALLLYQMAVLPGWMAVLIVAALIVTDLLKFPRVRRYYSSDPSELRIIGEQGIATTDLTPHGFVKVRGELWQGRTVDPAVSIRRGEVLSVRGINGLELVVERTGQVEQKSATPVIER